jgi:hypothetical protein
MEITVELVDSRGRMGCVRRGGAFTTEEIAVF